MGSLCRCADAPCAPVTFGRYRLESRPGHVVLEPALCVRTDAPTRPEAAALTAWHDAAPWTASLRLVTGDTSRWSVVEAAAPSRGHGPAAPPPSLRRRAGYLQVAAIPLCPAVATAADRAAVWAYAREATRFEPDVASRALVLAAALEAAAAQRCVTRRRRRRALVGLLTGAPLLPAGWFARPAPFSTGRAG